jgi:hypothetical protein
MHRNDPTAGDRAMVAALAIRDSDGYGSGDQGERGRYCHGPPAQ